MSFHTVFSCLFSVRTKTHEHYRKIEYIRKRMVTESMCQMYTHTPSLSLSLFVSLSFTVGSMYALCMLANENGNDDRDADMHDFVQEFSSHTKYVGVLQSANQQCDYVKVLFRWAKIVCVSRRWTRPCELFLFIPFARRIRKKDISYSFSVSPP